MIDKIYFVTLISVGKSFKERQETEMQVGF